MRKVQVGFIGAGGFISAYHLLTVRDNPNMDISAIADIDEEKLKKHSSRMKVGYITTDYKKILQDSSIDIVIIGTKQNLHARLIIESLQSGKWVFCEKPMAENEEETRSVLAAEKSAKGKLAIGFNRRFAPAYVRAKQLMQKVPRPWYLNYRLMYPNPDKQDKKNFYAVQPRILYEGCHILDIACWFMETAPESVFMAGDPLLNNCCILSFPDGSQVSFMCGSMGSFGLWKEYMEFFGDQKAITVSDFVDMRVRGWEGEYDRLYPPYLKEHADEVMKYGFDFYEMYKGAELYKYRMEFMDKYGIDIVPVLRPISLPFDISQFKPVHPDLWSFIPDKGWVQSIEHFAESFLSGSKPENADGKAGALSTEIALALLQSLKTGKPVSLDRFK